MFELIVITKKAINNVETRILIIVANYCKEF